MKKALAIVLVAIIGISGLSFAVAFASADGSDSRGWGWAVGSWLRRGINAPVQRSWVRLNGIIKTWDSQEVNGSLSVNARTTGFEGEVLREAALVTAIWSNTTNFRQRGNFSYSFYVARLVDVNVTALNFENVDFFLNGTWNVFNVSISQTVITSGDLESHYTVDRQTKRDIEPIATEADGELNVTGNVTGNWTEFLLSIDGVGELNGVVTRARIKQTMFNKFKVSEDGTDKVTRIDLSILAKNYGAMPGWGSFNSNMDFNCNYKIDIADLATVAANVEA